jgi:hypothetical protein
MKEYYSNSTIGFSSQAPTNKSRKRALILIDIWVEFPRRRAHGFSKEGAPSVEVELPSVGEWAATSPHSKHVSNKVNPRRVRHLLRVWAATSRVRHLSKRGAPLNIPCAKYLLRYGINQMPINLILSPLTPS